jgi:hypothetical protein
VPYKTSGALSSTGNALPIESIIYNWSTDYVNTRIGWNTNNTVKQYVDDAINNLTNSINTNIANQLTALTNRVAFLELICNAFKGPNGAVLAWRRADIPAGWQEVTNLRGRTIVGWDPAQSEFSILNGTYGSKTHALTTNEMPAHKHGFDNRMSTSDSWKTTGGSGRPSLGAIENAWNNQWEYKDSQSTRSSGDGAPHNNVQPSYMCKFIEFVG